MEVSSATASLQQQYPVARAPSQETRPAREREGATQQTEASSPRNEAPQRAERNEQTQRAAQAAEAQRQEQPKPVVNAQGQKTGTIINTTA